MNSGLVYLRPTRLTYVRAIGPYETSIPEAWQKMYDWIDKNGLHSPTGQGYGLARDNPAKTGAAHCRYDACIQVTPMFEERAARELGLITLPAGPYTRQRHAGPYENTRSIISGIHSTAVLPAELRLDDRRPIVTIYLEDPRRSDAKDLRADICVPVTANRASRDNAQAA